MAITVRCQQCRKKISIDEAFAGGICRCPYCKALTQVGGSIANQDSSARPQRPDAPAGARPAAPRPERPGTPPGRPAAPGMSTSQSPTAPAGAARQAPTAAQPSAETTVAPEHIPIARPVLIQGVVAIVMAGLLLVIITVGIVGYFMLRNQTEPIGTRFVSSSPATPSVTPTPNPNPNTNTPALPRDPFADRSKPNVAGMAMLTPAVYVVNFAGGMRDAADPATAVVRHSILSLQASDKFNIIVARDGATAVMAPAPAAGGQAGNTQAKTFFSQFLPGGGSDLPAAIAQALEQKPRTIVILTNSPVPGAADLAEKAKSAGVVLLGVGISSAADLDQNLEELTKPAQGMHRRFGESELADKLNSAPELP